MIFKKKPAPAPPPKKYVRIEAEGKVELKYSQGNPIFRGVISFKTKTNISTRGYYPNTKPLTGLTFHQLDDLCHSFLRAFEGDTVEEVTDKMDAHLVEVKKFIEAHNGSSMVIDYGIISEVTE